MISVEGLLRGGRVPPELPPPTEMSTPLLNAITQLQAGCLGNAAVTHSLAADLMQVTVICVDCASP